MIPLGLLKILHHVYAGDLFRFSKIRRVAENLPVKK